MELLKNLISDDVGLLSIFTIGFVFVIGGFIGNFVKNKMNGKQ